MSAKRQKTSAQANATAAAVEKLLDGVPADELDGTLAAVELKLKAAKVRLKALGKDAHFERLVRTALSWISQARPTRESDKPLPTDAVRKLLTHLKVTKAKASFDEESSDMSGNTQGADFDIQFAVGSHEGYLNGSAAETEGVEYTGQLDTSFLPLLEDDLLQHVSWETRCYYRVKNEVSLWLMEAGVVESELHWLDACRAVAAAVFVLAKESTYNEEPWVFEFLEKRVREELQLCPRDRADLAALRAL